MLTVARRYDESCAQRAFAMRFVIDTNEAAALARTTAEGALNRKRITVVLPPLVWAEILLSPYHKQRFSALAEYNLMFGMDLPDVHAHLSSLTEQQIASFDPVISANSVRYEKLMLSMLESPDELSGEARRLKNDAACASANVVAHIQHLNKRDKDAKSRGELVSAEKFVTIDQAMDNIGKRIQTQLLSDVTSDGGRPMRAASAESLYQAVMGNVYLGRYLRLLVCVQFGYRHAWQDENLNIDPSANRNDYTDMTIGLYAGDGDIIVTRDKKLRNAIRHIDPQGKVKVKTWEECAESLGQ